MALLGDGWNDPQSGAIMALSAGLLGRNFAGGLLGAQNAYTQAKQAQTKAAFDKMQMDMAKEELAMKRMQVQQATAKDAEMRDFWNKMRGGGAAQSATYSPGQLGSGSFGVVANANPMAPAQPQAGARAGGLAGLTPDDVAYAKARLGLDLIEPWKVAKHGFEKKPGTYYLDPTTNRLDYLSDPEKGYTVQNGVVGDMPGWMDAQVRRTLAVEGPKALLGAAGRVNLRTMPDGTTAPVSELTENPTLAGVLGNIFGGAPIPRQGQGGPVAPSPRVPVRGNGAGDPPAGAGIVAPQSNRTEALNLALQQSTALANDPKLSPADRERAARDVEDINREIRMSGGGQPAQGRYGKTTAQETKDAASKEYAIGVAKDMVEVRKNIFNAGLAASKSIAKYQQLGGLLEGVDGGVLTPLGTNLASMANSLGFKLDKNLPNKEAAAALANEMALELRNPANGAGMPGAMSEKDRDFLVSMTPSSSQTAEGRKMIISSAIALAQRNQQVADFARKYEKKYGQLDNGFFDQLSAWSSANPLFTKGK